MRLNALGSGSGTLSPKPQSQIDESVEGLYTPHSRAGNFPFELGNPGFKGGYGLSPGLTHSDIGGFSKLDVRFRGLL